MGFGAGEARIGSKELLPSPGRFWANSVTLGSLDTRWFPEQSLLPGSNVRGFLRLQHSFSCHLLPNPSVFGSRFVRCRV